MVQQASVLEALNLALRFGLEIASLLALGYWGFGASDNEVVRVVFGLGAPLVAALLWGAFISPKAIARLEDPVRMLVELVFFGAATGALAARIGTAAAGLFAVLVVANLSFMFVLRQRGR